MKPTAVRPLSSFNHLHDMVDNASIKQDAKLRAKADNGQTIRLFERGAKRSVFSDLKNLTTGRNQARQLVKEALREVLSSNPELLDHEEAAAAIFNIEEHVRKRGHDLDAGLLKKNLAIIARAQNADSHRDQGISQQQSAIAHANSAPTSSESSSLHPVALPEAADESVREDRQRLEGFAGLTNASAASTLDNLHAMLGLKPGDPCIEKFQAYARHHLDHPDAPASTHDFAHVLEFARRWTAAATMEEPPKDFFGFGKAVNSLVVKLAAEHLTPTGEHRASLSHTPKALESNSFARACRDLREMLEGGHPTAQVEALAYDLGQEFAKELRSAPKAVQMTFAASAGTVFKEELKLKMLASEGFAALSENQKGRSTQAVTEFHEGFQKFLDIAFKEATAKLPDHVTATEEVRNKNDVPYLKVNSFQLAGVDYAFDRDLAEGGFGAANLYKGVVNGEEKYVVLKTSIPHDEKSTAQLQQEAEMEVKAHIAATTLEHSRVIGLEGVMKMPDGTVAIALEYASHGTLFEGIPKLHAAIDHPAEGGQALTSEQATAMLVTLAKNVLEGLQRLQDAQVSHLDLKTPNLIVDGQGVVKVCDLGTARKGTGPDLNQSLHKNPIDNPTWRDPLMAKAFEPITDKTNELLGNTREFSQTVKMAYKEFEKAGATKGELAAAKVEANQLVGNAIAAEKLALEEVNKIQVAVKGKAADAWSVGTVLYQLFCNADPFPSPTGFAADVVSKQDAYMEMDEATRRETLFAVRPAGDAQGPVRPASASPVPKEIQDAILALMDPDPTKRANPKDLLAQPIFADLDVDSVATRDLIKATLAP